MHGAGVRRARPGRAGRARRSGSPDPRRTGCDQILFRLAVRGRDACPCARLRLWTLTWRPAQEDAPDVSRDTGRSAGTPRARRRTAARRATAVMVVSSALLAVSPLGSIVAVAEDPPTTSAPAPTTPASDSTSSAPGSSSTAPGSSDAPTTTGPSSSTTNPQGPSVDTVDPTTTTTPGDSTTSSSAPPLAVSAILQAANPFDATHGFTVLARHAGELRAGTTLGAVAVGGDLRFGPYSVTPTPPAQLDETPIGLLVGGSVGLGSSAGRLTVGDDARLLIGKVGAAQTAAVDGGVAVLPAGADVAADPQLRANGPQEPQTVSSPGTFERAFGGVFADLAARGRTLAKLKPTLTPTAADGGAIASAGLPRADVHLAAGDDDGPSVWSVHAADLAQIGSITIDPAPTEQRPLVINVDGDGGKVLLDRAVTVDAAARADIVWNVVDAKAVVVAQPLAGSLLAPTAPVQIDADVSGQVVADSVVQRDGTVGGTPFAAELPKVADTTTTTEPPPSSTQPDTSAVDPAAEAVPETVPPATGNNAVITVKVGSERPSASAVNPLPGVTLQLFDGTNAPTTCGHGRLRHVRVRPERRLLVHRAEHAAGRRDEPGPALLGRPDGYAHRLVRSHSVRHRRQRPVLVDPVPVPHRRSAPGRQHLRVVRHQRHVHARHGQHQQRRVRWHLAVVAQQPEPARHVRPQRRPRARRVGLGRQLARLAQDRREDLHQLARRHALAGRALHLRHRGPGQHHEQPEPPGHPRLDPDRSRHGERLDRRSDRGEQHELGPRHRAGGRERHPLRRRHRHHRRQPDGLRQRPGAGELHPPPRARERHLLGQHGEGQGDPDDRPRRRRRRERLAQQPHLDLGTDRQQRLLPDQRLHAAGAALRALALGTCQGTISVVKQVVPSTAPPGSITGAVPAGGWQFGATTTASGVAINPTSGTTAAASGALNFNLSFPGGTTTAPVTVTETQQAGYTLVQQGGLNATCRRLDTNAAVTVTNSGANGFLVTAATAFPVSCTVYNRAPSPAATVVVNKKWLINGQSFDEGTQPSGFAAALTIGGVAQGWGVVRTGFQQGDTTVLNETVSLRGLQCTLISSLVTLANGTTVSARAAVHGHARGAARTPTRSRTPSPASRG